jgi:hypothetical protein
MMSKVSWGVLGVAQIAVEKVIPAMQLGTVSRVDAIASRDIEKAKHAAAALGIERSYGSYEELLADPAIEAIYNPLARLESSREWRAIAARQHFKFAGLVAHAPLTRRLASKKDQSRGARQRSPLQLRPSLLPWSLLQGSRR